MRRDILRIAVKFFHTYGIKALSMNDIAQLAGISVKVLNKHFVNKESLLRACIEYCIYQEKLFRYTDAGVMDMLLNYAETYPVLYQEINRRCCMDIKKYYKPVYRYLIEQTNCYALICESKVKQGIAEGYISKKSSPRLIYLYLLEHFSRLFTVDVYYTHADSKLMTDSILAFVKGISTLKGRSYIEQKLKTTYSNEID